MSRLILFLFIFLVYNSLSFSQEKEDVYLIYGNIKDTCQYSPNRDGSNSKYYLYEPRFRSGCFTFCNQYFLIKSNATIEEIKESKLDSLNIISIDYILRKREENKKNQLTNPNKLFNKIYVLVKDISNSYLKFEVYWKEVYLNSDLIELELIEN